MAISSEVRPCLCKRPFHEVEVGMEVHSGALDLELFFHKRTLLGMVTKLSTMQRLRGNDWIGAIIAGLVAGVLSHWFRLYGGSWTVSIATPVAALLLVVAGPRAVRWIRGRRRASERDSFL
jgi:uncharacterized membrane protein (UPF0136 family)